MERGFLYLVAIMDWHSRATLSWRLPNTMEADQGRWMDNVMIERLWNLLKYGCVYLRELETGSDLRNSLV